MIDIFVSYAREDQARVEPLIDWLEACGFSVWWDKRISPGSPFDDEIETNLNNAKAVLVVWSKRSITSNWVQTEANEGMEVDKLVPILLDDVRPPLAFRRIQAAPLIGFPNKYDEAVLLQVRKALSTLTAQQLPRPPEPPRTPTKPRPWLWAGAVVILLLGTFLWNSKPSQRVPIHFTFSAFGAERAEDRAVYASLAEEIAFALQRDTSVAVTSPDARALPSGYVVSGQVLPAGLQISVKDVANNKAMLERLYPADAGLGAVNNRISQDLAALVDSTSHQVSYANPTAYRQYLLSSALLREAPTLERLANAQGQFAALVNEHPRFARAYARLCSVELKLYRDVREETWFNAAERHCHRALTLDESDWEVMLSLADLYRTSGQFEKALDMANRAGQLHPNSGAVQRQIGIANLVAGRDGEALQAYQRALVNEPGYWRNYNAIGEYHFKKGQYAEAAEYFALEIEHVRDKALSLNNLAGAFYLQGDEAAAITAWQESIAEEPTINALMNLGSVSFFNRDFSASEDYYRSAQNLAPQDQRIAGHIADALAAGEDPAAPAAYEQALALASKALLINPEDRNVMRDVATYHAALAQPKQAVELLEKARTDNPDIDELYDRLLVFVRLDRHDDATKTKTRLTDMGYPQHLIDADANLHP